MFHFVYSHPEDYGAREIDIRIKHSPTKRDIENINIVVEEIINQHTISPVKDPFIFLWLCQKCTSFHRGDFSVIEEMGKKANVSENPIARKALNDKKGERIQGKSYGCQEDDIYCKDGVRTVTRK